MSSNDDIIGRPQCMGGYDDIIDLPHHQSSRHPRMSMLQRAAQFASFAALSGHDEAISQTARTNAASYETEYGDEDF